MGDYYQNGVISTLHDLEYMDLEKREADLLEFSKFRPMSLVLPSLFSELEGPALKHIVDELQHVKYLSQIIIGLDRADKEQFEFAKHYFSPLGDKCTILWNDGPRLRELDLKLQNKGLAPKEAGKGRNVWYCMGYFIATNQARIMALHDCDILTYSREMPAKLLYPLANPLFNYQFCKGYYFRVADQSLKGRVCRLLVTPLIRALKKVSGGLDYLEYLDSFRYPLAGEFAMSRQVVKTLRIPSDWGLEIGVLSEVQRNHNLNKICQTDITDCYDHKHQDISLDNKSAGLSKMSTDISKAIFRKMATKGYVFSEETFRSIKATYYRTALDFIERYYADAVFNGLKVDRHQEEEAVEMFAQNIFTAGQIFLENPRETPFIPSWERIWSAYPGFVDEITNAVELDNQY